MYNSIKKISKKISPHPILLAIFPILYLYNRNIEIVSTTEVLVTASVSAFSAITIFLIINFFVKDRFRSEIITSAFLIIFFSYGHVYLALENRPIVNQNLANHAFLAPASILLFTLIFFTVKKVSIEFIKISKILNIIGLTLLIITIPNIISYYFKSSNETELIERYEYILDEKPQDNLPDIYYIILDGYARKDILAKLYDYDNSPFIKDLENIGFYVAKESKSNFTVSMVSIASSLNMQYINSLTEKLGADSIDSKPFGELIKDNEVSRYLRIKGYTYVHFRTGFNITDKNPYADIEFSYRQRSEFVKSIFQTSALIIIERYINDNAHSILYIFDKLPEIAENSNPTFTFAHIISPHNPYVFDEDGNIIPQDIKRWGGQKAWSNRKDYLSQLKFVNKKIIETVEMIIEKSKEPPIIIIQSDHGPASSNQYKTKIENLNPDQLEERAANLNAYYLPKKVKNHLYDTITPVNSFRLLFKYYFGEDLDLLEDRSYYSQTSKPLKFIDVSR